MRSRRFRTAIRINYATILIRAIQVIIFICFERLLFSGTTQASTLKATTISKATTTSKTTMKRKCFKSTFNCLLATTTTTPPGDYMPCKNRVVVAIDNSDSNAYTRVNYLDKGRFVWLFLASSTFSHQSGFRRKLEPHRPIGTHVLL